MYGPTHGYLLCLLMMHEAFSPEMGKRSAPGEYEGAFSLQREADFSVREGSPHFAIPIATSALINYDILKETLCLAPAIKVILLIDADFDLSYPSIISYEIYFHHIRHSPVFGNDSGKRREMKRKF